MEAAMSHLLRAFVLTLSIAAVIAGVAYWLQQPHVVIITRVPQ
jgi:predicted secreted protein